MKRTNNNHRRSNTKGKVKVEREQPKKDSRGKRVNFDNMREDKIKDISCTDKSNDVSWYAHNPEMLRSAASLPFSQSTGTALPFTTGRTVPGAMALYWTPSLGSWDTDAVKAASDSTYSYVVHANSRNTSYNNIDLMLVILAGAELFATIAYAIRAYGVMKLYDQRNKYLPKALIQLMGFDFEDLQSNLANMWFDINNMIAKSQQIWIPNVFPFIDRWFWMNSNLYMDSESVKGQYYFFSPERFLGYAEKFSSAGGGLGVMNTDGTVATTTSTITPYNGSALLNTTQNTWSGFKTMINGMFSALLDSEDRGIIMGDILKAYGADRIYALTPVTAEYVVTPVYDREVLTQIENATVYTNSIYGVYQDPNTNTLRVRYAPASFPDASTTLDSFTLGQSVLNFHQKEIPTPEQIMVATRLKVLGAQPYYSPISSGAQGIMPSAVGTEVINSIATVMIDSDQLEIETYHTQLFSSTMDAPAVYKMTAFDWCPWLYRTIPFSSSANNIRTADIAFAIGEWDNYTIVDTETLKKMHTTALYSEFNVPTIS